MVLYYGKRSVIPITFKCLWPVLLACLPFISSAQESVDDLAADKIAIKFLRTAQSVEIFSPVLSNGELLKSWLWRSTEQQWPEFQLEAGSERIDFKPGRLGDFSQYKPALNNYPGLDYRGTSYYQPENVREYLDYKMGREPYLPVFNPVLLGFILYNLQHYLFKSPPNEAAWTELGVPEVKLLQILLEKYPLGEQEWYGYYQQLTQDSLFSRDDFQNAIGSLKKRWLVVQQLTTDKELKYFPSPTAPSFYLHSKP